MFNFLTCVVTKNTLLERHLLQNIIRDSAFSDKYGRLYQFLCVCEKPTIVFISYQLNAKKLYDLYEYPIKSSTLNIFEYCGDFFDTSSFNCNRIVKLEEDSIYQKYECLPSSIKSNSFCLLLMTSDTMINCEHCT